MFSYCYFLLWTYSLFEKSRLFWDRYRDRDRSFLDQKFWDRDWDFFSRAIPKLSKKWEKSQHREVLRRDITLWFPSFILIYYSCSSLSILHIFLAIYICITPYQLAIRLRSNRNISEISQSSFCLGKVSQDLNWMQNVLLMLDNCSWNRRRHVKTCGMD